MPQGAGAPARPGRHPAGSAGPIPRPDPPVRSATLSGPSNIIGEAIRDAFGTGLAPRPGTKADLTLAAPPFNLNKAGSAEQRVKLHLAQVKAGRFRRPEEDPDMA